MEAIWRMPLKVRHSFFSELLNSDDGTKSIDSLSEEFDECLDSDSEYLILRVFKDGVECLRRGGVVAKIIKDGQISVLPNGYFGLSQDDRIICATARFYRF